MSRPFFALSRTLPVALAWLTPQLALGQVVEPAAKPEPAAEPAAGETAPEAGVAPGTGEAAGESKGGAEPAGSRDPDADVASGLSGYEGPYYKPPMVEIDYRQEQPEGYVREPHHDHRWFYHNLTALRVNPLGLTNRFRTGYQVQLSHRPETIFEQSHASVQLDTELTPAFGGVGTRLEVQPAALFNLWASYGFVGTFASFSHTRSFPSAQADYSDSTLSDTRDEDYATIGHRAVVSALFQFGMGGVALRDNIKGHWMSMDLHDGDHVFYDATLDVLVPNVGWVLTNDADLLVITEFNLTFGVRHTFTEAFYKADHLGGGDNINTPHHRVGPAFIYTFFDDGPGTGWNKPTLILLAQWWMEHRYRTSEKPALPYLVLGFAQEGDFMISDKK